MARRWEPKLGVGMEVGTGGAVVSVALFDVCSGVELSMEVGAEGAVGVGALWQARRSRAATNRRMKERKSIREPRCNQDVGSCDGAQDTQVKTVWGREALTVLTVDHLLLWVRNAVANHSMIGEFCYLKGSPRSATH